MKIFMGWYIVVEVHKLKFLHFVDDLHIVKDNMFQFHHYLN